MGRNISQTYWNSWVFSQYLCTLLVFNLYDCIRKAQLRCPFFSDIKGWHPRPMESTNAPHKNLLFSKWFMRVNNMKALWHVSILDNQIILLCFATSMTNKEFFTPVHRRENGRTELLRQEFSWTDNDDNARTNNLSWVSVSLYPHKL